MALSDQIVEEVTRDDTAVAATTVDLSSVTLTQDDGAGTTGRYMLVAAVAVSSATGGVEITGLDFGGETMAPSRDSQTTTAGDRPATRMFSAGEWVSGSAQTPTVTVSGGNIADVAVHFMVLSETADECLPPYGGVPRTDTFNRLSLNPMWTLSQGDVGTATLTFAQTSGVIRAELGCDAGFNSYFDNRGLGLLQDMGDIDLDITLEKETTGGPSNLEGIVAEVAGTVHTNVVGTHYSSGGVYVASYSTGTENSRFDGSAGSLAETAFPRLIRTGNNWDFQDSSDGSTFGSVVTFTFAQTVAKVGVAFGSYVNNSRTFDLFRFINNDNPARDAQDAQTALQFLDTTAAAATSISLAFSENTTEGAGLVNIGIIAASDAAGAITEGTGDTLIASGLTSSTDGIRWAVVGALTEVSGTTSGTTIGGSWTGSAAASMSGDQYRVEELESGATNQAVGLSSETDSALAVTIRKEIEAGLSSETDAALAVTGARIKPVGLASETDSALDVTPVAPTIVAVGLASETDSALAVDRSRGFNVGLSAEADTAQPVTGSRTKPVGIASEADSAQSVLASKSIAVGIASEADSAQSVDITRFKAVGLAEETDAALGVSAVGPGAVEVGLAEETDTAQPITIRKEATADQAAETDSALSITPARIVDVGLSSETDTAQVITFRREVELGIAGETDSALDVTVTGGTTAAATRIDAGGGSGGNAQTEAEEWLRKRRLEEEELIMALLFDEVG